MYSMTHMLQVCLFRQRQRGASRLCKVCVCKTACTFWCLKGSAGHSCGIHTRSMVQFYRSNGFFSSVSCACWHWYRYFKEASDDERVHAEKLMREQVLRSSHLIFQSASST